MDDCEETVSVAPGDGVTNLGARGCEVSGVNG